MTPLARAIDEVLPQTQCTKCGYPACRAYAEAIASGETDINRCPPGGDRGIRALAALTGRAYRALDPACGEAGPRQVACIDEARCIGCTLCIRACPVDAIVGAAKLMHTVVTELCSGCDLCVAPCPVDCIAMLPASGGDAIWDEARAAAARARYEARQARLSRERAARRARLAAGADERTGTNSESERQDSIRATVAAALARARARRTQAKAKP